MMCYCGSNVAFSQCCEPYIYGNKAPQTASQLMRSRYTAFCINDVDYLNKTTSLPPITSIDSSIRWTGLTIIKSMKGGASDSTGIVEFNAFFIEENIDYILHEISQFKKQNECWLYCHGTSSISPLDSPK